MEKETEIDARVLGYFQRAYDITCADLFATKSFSLDIIGVIAQMIQEEEFKNRGL